MDVVDRFRRALACWEESDEAGPARLPIRLSKACVQVLPITGAGLSLFSAPTMRIPVGASDDTATAAEGAQFTVALMSAGAVSDQRSNPAPVPGSNAVD